VPVAFASGDVRIAYEVIGSGRDALVVVPGWASHLEVDWGTPEIRSYYRALAVGRRLVRYDKRGTGLSDRSVGSDTYAPSTQVEDLVRVMDAARVSRGAVLGWSEGGPIAIELATRWPERVSHLVLYGTYARLLAGEDYPHGRSRARATALLEFVRAEWGLGSKVLSDIFVPEEDPDRMAWFTRYQREAMSAQVAADYLAAAYRIDVRAELRGVRCPTLVLHRREDPVVLLEHGLWLAEHLPGARMQVLEGRHHLPFFGNRAAITDAIDAFLPRSGQELGLLSPRELEVLRLVAEGHSNRDIAADLQISQATVARHLVNLYAKLGVSTRAAAGAYAFRHGLV